MANYGVVRTDNVKATKTGAIKSGRFFDNTTATAIENGNIVKLHSLITGQRDLWKVVAPGGVTTADCYLVATPEIIYDETSTADGALNQFRNEVGENITLLQIEVGDTFSIADTCITAADTTPVVEHFVTPSDTGTKWKEVASIAKDEVFYGKIVARELYKKDTYLNVIEMIKVR